MIGIATYSYNSLLHLNLYGTDHDSFDETVHSEIFYNRSLEQALLYLVRHNKCSGYRNSLVFPVIVFEIGQLLQSYVFALENHQRPG